MTAKLEPTYREHPWVPTDDRQTIDLDVLGCDVSVTRHGATRSGDVLYLVGHRPHGGRIWETQHITVYGFERPLAGRKLRTAILSLIATADVGLMERTAT